MQDNANLLSEGMLQEDETLFSPDSQMPPGPVCRLTPIHDDLDSQGTPPPLPQQAKILVSGGVVPPHPQQRCCSGQ